VSDDMAASWPKQLRDISASAVSVRAALRAGAKPVGSQPARQLCERIVLFGLSSGSCCLVFR
jgi:hypothetical protein